MTFRVGQKLVCVNAPTGEPFGPYRAFPKLGQTYTYRGCLNEDSIYLAEIQNDFGKAAEVAFYKSRFRPAVDRKTDISLFTAMLNPSKQEIEA